jgi:hypothetical protein
MTAVRFLDGEWSVMSSVDAQNIFGAMRRSDFICKGTAKRIVAMVFGDGDGAIGVAERNGGGKARRAAPGPEDRATLGLRR